jgi:hypothetical protein
VLLSSAPGGSAPSVAATMAAAIDQSARCLFTLILREPASNSARNIGDATTAPMLEMAFTFLDAFQQVILWSHRILAKVGYTARFRLSAISRSAGPAQWGNRKSEKAKDEDRNPTLIGRGSDYDIVRLERDCPDLAARVRANEFSANAAAIEAGFRTKLTKGAQTAV